MTNTQVDDTNLVVVDGSNIATEGRSVPSLAQLNDAVISLTEEFPDITVTVVVDATFGHRIDKSEVREFDEAVAHNELVSPPAGAIGRGDAFVLSIANKVGARIFSNDSFQEFHGVYPWLFDEGRLIGGKPVPNVGWVFVNRVPVKGPISRKARGAGRDGSGVRRPASQMASLPMPIPTSPPPRAAATVTAEPDAPQATPGQGRSRRRKSDGAAAVAEPVPATGRDATAPPSTSAAPPSGGPVNDLLPFLDFIQSHPVGSNVTGAVESYSSHGAYVTIGDLRGYVPLRLMGNPPPRSAREVMRFGEQVTLVVASFAPARRSVDLAVPGVADVVPPEPAAAAPAPVRRGAKTLSIDTPVADDAAETANGDAGQPRGRRRKAAAAKPEPATTRAPRTRGRTTAPEPAPAPPAKTASARNASSKRAGATMAPAAKAAAKKSAKPATTMLAPALPTAMERTNAAKQSGSKRAAALAPLPPPSVPPETPSAPAKRAAAKRSAPKKAAAKQAPAARAQAKVSGPEINPDSKPAPRRRRAQPSPTE